MFDQNAAHGTVSISFVYIRPKGTNSALSTRIPYPSSLESLMKTAHRLFDGMMNVASLFTESGQRIRSLDDITPGMSILVSNCEEDMSSPRRNPPSPVIRKKRQIMSTDSFALLFGTDGPQSNVQDMNEAEPKTFSFADNTTPTKEPRQKPKFVSRRQKAKAEEQKRAAERQQRQAEELERQSQDGDQKRIRLVIRPTKAKTADAEEAETSETKRAPTITIKKAFRSPHVDQTDSSATHEDTESASETNTKGIRLVRKITNDKRSQASETRSHKSFSMEPSEYSTELLPEPGSDEDVLASEERLSGQNEETEPGHKRKKEREGPHCRLQSKPRIQRLIEEEERRAEEERKAEEERMSEEARLLEQESSESKNTEDTEGHKRRKRNRGHRHKTTEDALTASEPSTVTNEGDDEATEESENRRKGRHSHRRHKSHTKTDSEISTTTQEVEADEEEDAIDEVKKELSESDLSTATLEEVTADEEEERTEKRQRKRRTKHHKHGRKHQSISESTASAKQNSRTGSSALFALAASASGKDKEESDSDYLSESDDDDQLTKSQASIASTKSKSETQHKDTESVSSKASVASAKSKSETQRRDNESISSKASMARDESGAKTPTALRGTEQAKTPTPGRSGEGRTPSRRTPVKREANPEKVREVFRSLIGENSIEEKIGTALENLPVYQDSLEVIPTIEEQQRSAWYAKLLEFAATQGLEPLGDDIYGIDDMIGHARCLLMNGRFNTGDLFSHRHNIGIVGPRKSGKSTFLRLLTDEVLVDLAATGEWKKTFVFILDWARLAPVAQDFEAFYHGMVALVCQMLQWQRPHLSKYLSMIQKYFDSVTSLKNSPKFPKAFTVNEETRALSINLQKISDHLSSLWNDPTALVQWITSVIRFPIEISKAFGFAKTIMIMDHVDTADVTLSGLSDPFIESKEIVCLVDVIKFTSKNVNFIMACQDQGHFYSVLPSPTDDDSTNLTDQIELVSMIGLVPDPEDDRQIVINLVGDVASIPFTVDTCGGIPSYLQVWEELNAMFDDLEADEENREEKQIMLNVNVQEIMKLFFVPADNVERRFEVESVRRTTKKSK